MNANLFRAEMAKKGISQRTMAEMAEMSENTLSSKVNGKSPITDVDIFKFCKILEITDPKLKCDIFLAQSS